MSPIAMKAEEPTSSSSTVDLAREDSATPTDLTKEAPKTGLNSSSRNARAQARHRAKRKAYIEQLESSVRELTDALTSIKQRGGEESSGLRLMAVEADNAQLRQEVTHLRHENNIMREQLSSGSRRSSPTSTHMHSPPTPMSATVQHQHHQQHHSDAYSSTRDPKRKRMSGDESYLMAPQAPELASQPGGAGGGEPSGSMVASHVSHYDGRSRGHGGAHASASAPMGSGAGEISLPHIATMNGGVQAYPPRYSVQPSTLPAAPSGSNGNFNQFVTQKSSNPFGMSYSNDSPNTDYSQVPNPASSQPNPFEHQTWSAAFLPHPQALNGPAGGNGGSNGSGDSHHQSQSQHHSMLYSHHPNSVRTLETVIY